MASVLLRATWLDALDLNPEPKPPDGELRESEQGIGRRERRAVVGANRSGKAKVPEGSFEYGEGEV